MPADLLAAVKHAAELVPSTMAGPDSDWVPILMYQQQDGTCRTAAIPGITRDTLGLAAQTVHDLLLDTHAVQAVLLLPTIWSELDADGVDKSERVMVTHVTKDSTHIEAALIYRSKTERPMLGPWDRVADDTEVGGGVFVDALRTAIT